MGGGTRDQGLVSRAESTCPREERRPAGVKPQGWGWGDGTKHHFHPCKSHEVPEVGGDAVGKSRRHLSPSQGGVTGEGGVRRRPQLRGARAQLAGRCARCCVPSRFSWEWGWVGREGERGAAALGQRGQNMPRARGEGGQS